MSVGIYLPNMETPKDCLKCPFCLFADGYWKCLVDGSHADFGGTCRPSLCPIVPVPEHGRLGDLDELYASLKKWLIQNRHSMTEATKVWIRGVLEGIAAAPTIIPADKEET